MRETWVDVVFKTFSMFIVVSMGGTLIAILIIIACKAIGFR
jgi:hypothetical protein